MRTSRMAPTHLPRVALSTRVARRETRAVSIGNDGMKRIVRLATFGLVLSIISAQASAQTLRRDGAHAYKEGAVVNVYSIRTAPGKFDEYMDFVDKTWKATQEAGYVENYKVVKVEPRGENDPDIYLIVYFKNWAALDDSTAKADALAKNVEGSVSAANESTVDRGAMRRILGSWTGQELDLK
jgi:hypothetical protein